MTTPATAFTAGSKVRSCTVCDSVLEYIKLDADVESMPIIYLVGDYEGAYVNNEKIEVDMTATYVDPDGLSFEVFATIKAQGASSLNYAKKNYTIKFYKDAEHDSKYKVDLGWGKESKYVLKANWVDYTQARNIIACRLWGDMVKIRTASDIQERLAALKTNGGAIDGYPVAVYMNGEFHGLYTLNVPKDDWMFGMGEKDANGNKSETEALMGADTWNETNFSSLIGYFKEDENGDYVTAGWELKYCGSDDITWVTDSFNELIQFCWDNEGEAFKNGISEHLDVDAAIDYLIYMYVIYMRDNTSKNMLWATYDGKVWIPSVYDQDGTFGMVWDGIRYAPANEFTPRVNDGGSIDVGYDSGPTTTYDGKRFILWDRMWNSFTEEILLRYKQLRESVLSYEYMVSAFEEFRACIPESVYEADCAKWESARAGWWTDTELAWYDKFDWDYTYEWIGNRLSYMDDAMRNVYENAYLIKTDEPAL